MCNINVEQTTCQTSYVIMYDIAVQYYATMTYLGLGEAPMARRSGHMRSYALTPRTASPHSTRVDPLAMHVCISNTRSTHMNTHGELSIET